MKSKGSLNNFSRLVTAAAIVALVAVTGCARPPVYEGEELGEVRVRRSPQQGIGLGVGALAVGVGALLGGGSKNQEQTQQQGSEQGKEAEQAKEQKQ